MEERKSDHIILALGSRLKPEEADKRFDYEPLSKGIMEAKPEEVLFFGKKLRVPMWASSMTGGTSLGRTINTNLARACNDFGMGMGLGSCRILLDKPEYLSDFDVRDIIGPDLPLFANIGIAQVELMIADKSWSRLEELVNKLRADGLIIHINPIQEWLQPEGDEIHRPPIETIEEFLTLTKIKVVLKEVGQGMGPESIRAALKLNIEGFELAAFGGTNFAKLELSRSNPQLQELYAPLSHIGHNAEEMLGIIGQAIDSGQEINCSHIIISGGITSFLDGYYLINKSKLPAVFGQASGFLNYARGDYQDLRSYVEHQVKGLEFARAYLRVKNNE
ncbi:MAG: isopentenyl-diphosphate delta-isomerase [Bacteroidota bacterium]